MDLGGATCARRRGIAHQNLTGRTTALIGTSVWDGGDEVYHQFFVLQIEKCASPWRPVILSVAIHSHSKRTITHFVSHESDPDARDLIHSDTRL
jgi:hypothetical protein